MSAGYVYLIKSETGLYKIGKSRVPDKRAHDFSLKLPFAIEVACLIESEDYHAAEKAFHVMFAKHRVNGEWFALPDEAVSYLLSQGQPYVPKEPRRAGRPVGTLIDKSLRRNAHDVTLTEDAWSHAQSNGNASRYIEGLILAHENANKKPR